MIVKSSQKIELLRTFFVFFFLEVNFRPYWTLNLEAPTKPPKPFTTWARPRQQEIERG